MSLKNNWSGNVRVLIIESNTFLTSEEYLLIGCWDRSRDSQLFLAAKKASLLSDPKCELLEEIVLFKPYQVRIDFDIEDLQSFLGDVNDMRPFWVAAPELTLEIVVKINQLVELFKNTLTTLTEEEKKK